MMEMNLVDYHLLVTMKHKQEIEQEFQHYVEIQGQQQI